jgi:hypothetical protein
LQFVEGRIREFAVKTNAPAVVVAPVVKPTLRSPEVSVAGKAADLADAGVVFRLAWAK